MTPLCTVCSYSILHTLYVLSAPVPTYPCYARPYLTGAGVALGAHHRHALLRAGAHHCCGAAHGPRVHGAGQAQPGVGSRLGGLWIVACSM